MSSMLEKLKNEIDALESKTITVKTTNPITSLPDDPTFWDRLWREHLKAAYERDEARRTP